MFTCVCYYNSELNKPLGCYLRMIAIFIHANYCSMAEIIVPDCSLRVQMLCSAEANEICGGASHI